MAIVKDEEQQQGQGTSQALGQGMAGQPQPEEQQPQQASSTPATIGASQPSQTSMPMPKQPKAGTGTFANLRSYLQAAQGGGQQRVAQAATQQVQKLGAGAQKGTQQAQDTFKTKMKAGSGALFQGGQNEEDVKKAAKEQTADILAAAAGVTYQAPEQRQPTQLTPEQIAAQNETRANLATTPPPPITPYDTMLRSTPETVPNPNRVQAPAVPTTAPAQPQQYFTPAQTEQFSQIINAQYQGPASLQQAGLYEQAAQKARTAQEAAQKTQTALGREQLLKDVFGRTREYGRGVSKLDALLLNTSQQGVKQLQEQAQPAAQAQEALQAAQNLSTNEAAQRQAAIEGIRSGARQEFTGARKAEEEATEKRIDDLIKTPAVDAQGNKITKLDSAGKPIVDAAGNPVYQTEWDRLPEYFKQSLATKAKPQWELSAEEAAVLGIGAGEGLYNIRPEDIKAAEAQRSKLITKDELARQQALAQLAGQDVARELQKDLTYTDMEKAGTQDLASSLDVESFRRLLDKSQAGFKTAAEGATLTGTGEKKVSRGNLAGKKTKTYGASVEGNVADMLRQAGYDVGAEGEGVKSLLSDKDLLNKYLGATSTNTDIQQGIGGAALEGVGAGASAGASIGSMTGTGPVGAGIGAAIGGAVGGLAGANTLDKTQLLTDLAKELDEKLGIKGLGTIATGVQDARSKVGGAISNVGGSSSGVIGSALRGIGGAIGGINTGEMKSFGSAIAKDLAIQDLQNQYAQFLQGQGFENRANIVDTQITRDRTAALTDLLRRRG